MKPSRLLLGLLLLLTRAYADDTSPVPATTTALPTVTTTNVSPEQTTKVSSQGTTNITPQSSSAAPASTSFPQTQTTVVPETPYLNVMITRVENPAGTLQNGKACSKFAFAGSMCSLHLQFCVSDSNSESDCEYNDYGVISTGSNVAQLQEASYNNNANPINVPLNSYFDGFKFKVRLTNQNNELIDEWTGQYKPINPTLQGITIFSSEGTRTDGTSTSLQLAWISNAPTPTTVTSTPVTTTVMASTVSTTMYTGPTTEAVSTATPILPVDCEEVPTRKSGKYKIYPAGGDTGVDVYCVFSPSTLSGALTVIQSRDASKKDDEWKLTFEDYKDPFGNVLGNYWLGLDNMNLLALNNTYNLRIDVCCNKNLVDSQIYKNFTLDKDNGYTLNAVSTIDKVGLAFKNAVADSTEPFSKTDIGAKFGTFASIATDQDLMSLVDSCDILGEVTSTGSQNFTLSGGWWFGSCTNNLNAPFPEKYTDDTVCLAEIAAASPGVQLRSLKSTALSSDVSFDGVSYTKVRMSIYRSDKNLIQLPPSDLCSS